MSSDESKFSEEDIKELIKDALKSNYNIVKKNNKKKVEIENAIVSTVEEFLTSFIIIGYDLNGNQLILNKSNTPMEKDALTSLAIKYISFLMYENGQ